LRNVEFAHRGHDLREPIIGGETEVQEEFAKCDLAFQVKWTAPVRRVNPFLRRQRLGRWYEAAPHALCAKISDGEILAVSRRGSEI
jgi:hypothetical protein